MAVVLSEMGGLSRATSCASIAAVVSACSGEMISDLTPGTQIKINDVPFTVAQTSRGLTVRNFETGATQPDILLTYAGLAAERVAGCPLTNITKETGVNTYYAAVSCPTA